MPTTVYQINPGNETIFFINFHFFYFSLYLAKHLDYLYNTKYIIQNAMYNLN